MPRGRNKSQKRAIERLEHMENMNAKREIERLENEKRIARMECAKTPYALQMREIEQKRAIRNEKIEIVRTVKTVHGTKKQIVGWAWVDQSNRSYHKPNDVKTSNGIGGFMGKPNVRINNDGDLYVKNEFIPTFGINTECYFGNARFEKSVDETGLNVKPFKRQTHSERTKNSHLNSSYRVRGDVKISGGHVSNEMTIASKHDAVEMEMGVL